MALVSYCCSDDEIEEENAVNEKDVNKDVSEVSFLSKDQVEPEFKMRVPKSAKIPGFSHNISTAKTKEGKILLSLPDLEDIDSSDDSDSEKQSNKIASVNGDSRTKRRSLLSLLPPTSSFIVREGSKPLIPHQLVRKNPVMNTLAKGGKNLKSNQPDVVTNKTEPELVLNNDHDDYGDDVENGSFFSFYKPEPLNPEAVASERASASLALTISELKNSKQTNTTTTTSSTINIRDCYPKAEITDPEILAQMSDIRKSIVDADQADLADEHFVESVWNEKTFVPGPERKRAKLSHSGKMSSIIGSGNSDYNNNTSTNFNTIEALLQNADVKSISQVDLTEGAQLEIVKSVTSEESQYKSKPIDDDPGKLAHRKHQITWLAYQAQENEVELEKRWAESRRNRASNRAKYGF